MSIDDSTNVTDYERTSAGARISVPWQGG